MRLSGVGLVGLPAGWRCRQAARTRASACERQSGVWCGGSAGAGFRARHHREIRETTQSSS